MTQANDLSLSTVDIEDEARGRMEVRLKALEDRVREVEKEKREMKEELWISFGVPLLREK